MNTNICFNSTIVRLKGRVDRLGRLQPDLFQFYDSTIKRFLRREGHNGQKGFQFYDSTIKSKHLRDAITKGVMFQFYDSTIKRNSLNGSSSDHFVSFNSTIVRLKVAMPRKGVRLVSKVSILR